MFYMHQYGFRMGYQAQHCLLVITEKMKQACDKNNVCAAVFTILLKCWIALNLIHLLQNYMPLILITYLLE